jgi:hypothetical protein
MAFMCFTIALTASIVYAVHSNVDAALGWGLAAFLVVTCSYYMGRNRGNPLGR